MRIFNHLSDNRTGLNILTFKTFCFVFSCLALLCASSSLYAEPAHTESPYGVCAHLGGGMEFDAMPENLRAMRAAGIRWARADFSWNWVERGKGNWHFEHLDKVLDEAGKAGITILPILDYNVSWAYPAHQHLDEWSEYVRRLVTRYKDRIRYWEVWNEENIPNFWKEPNPKDYLTLLKRTYEVIKEIDPELKVVFGGLAGVPHDYYENVLKEGGGKYFDIVNFHPYRGGMVTIYLCQRFLDDIKKFRDLTIQYTGSDKPLWITEMGWATPPAFGTANRQVIEAGLKQLYPNGLPGKFAALYDVKYDSSSQFPPVIMGTTVPDNVEIDYVSLDQLKTLSPKTHPCLLLPPGEHFPTPFFDDLVKYVRNGGTLILVGGVPLYYVSNWDSHGFLTSNGYASDSYRNTLRIGWEAWWTKKNVPEHARLAPAKEYEDLLKIAVKDEGSRFLNDSKLKPGDKLIPIINASTQDYTAPVAAVIKFDSDYKGALIVSTIMNGGNTNISSEPNQGVFLAQAYLLAFAQGVERYFWYEFQAVEQDDVDREHHFGMVHRDLSPKTGYLAMKTLTKMRPAGSVQTSDWRNDDFCQVSWKRPDGKTVVAIWIPGSEGERTIKLDSKIESACDCFGNPVKIPTAQGTEYTLKLSPKILYLVVE